MLELWAMQSTPLLPSLPGPFWRGVGAPNKVLSMGQIELNFILFQNWLFLNRTVFDIETVHVLNWIFKVELFWQLNVSGQNYTYTKMNCLNSNCLTKLNSLELKCFWELNWVLPLNWVVLNRTDYLYKNGFGGWHKTIYGYILDKTIHINKHTHICIYVYIYTSKHINSKK